MATRANKDTATRFDAMAARANKREQKKAPLLAYAGLVPIHTPDEQREKAERHERMACENERRRKAQMIVRDLAEAKLLAALVDSEQFRTIVTYARHCFPKDLFADVIDTRRKQIEAGLIPWCLTNETWREPMEFVELKTHLNDVVVPHRVTVHAGGRREDRGPLRDPYAPKPTPDELRATKERMDAEMREHEKGIPERRTQVEAWRRGEFKMPWQKCNRSEVRP